ncbi:protein of unknown function DUF2591 [Flyfo siphovirus Tbat1_6]|uniref:protein of unknown function DUF2591 n=1 Tax=Flyfo siphovirus Tbat1_6 TaxID=2907287 RepID=UPI00233E990F|nr:protein of unknown function DUF2591 [Flyfo siphovirus Tbat1_6]UIW10239.1 protein of unknown function DUF2591 [Flyfo siphovirus Tbat1_6]
MSTDYSKMSDFEINKRVFSLVMNGRDWNRQGSGVFDFCNNPADAWPIIVDNKISIVSLDNKWIAAPVDTVIDGITGDSDVCFYASSDSVFDTNPLRAAMIVFLVMQEGK